MKYNCEFCGCELPSNVPAIKMVYELGGVPPTCVCYLCINCFRNSAPEALSNKLIPLEGEMPISEFPFDKPLTQVAIVKELFKKKFPTFNHCFVWRASTDDSWYGKNTKGYIERMGESELIHELTTNYKMTYRFFKALEIDKTR